MDEIETQLSGRPRRARHGRKLTAAAAGALGFGAVGGIVGHTYFGASSPAPVSATTTAATGLTGARANASAATTCTPAATSAAAVAARVDPALVDVNTVIDYGEAEGAATGIVLTSTGEVLTNNHVVEGATSIKVTDVASHKTYTASVVGYDIAKDIAVIQLKGATGLKTATIGNSAAITVGEQVVAIGNANGTGGTPSYAAGTIVATNQSLSANDSLTGSTEQLSGMLETNADIIEGDSGGPLVNLSGSVLGVDTAGSSSFQFTGTSASQGYAVPINEAISIAKQIEAKKASATVHVGATAFLGVGIGASSSGGGGFSGFSGFSGGLGSPSQGVTITGVVANSPAAKAGLAAGDVITAIGGHAVTTTTSLTDIMVADEQPGAAVQVQYVDELGAQHTVTVTLASGPAQ